MMSEKHISKAVVNELALLHKFKKLSYFVNIEGAKRDVRQQRAAKLHGMRPGRPDIEIFLAGGRIVFLELKTLKGRLSHKQSEVHKELSNLGHGVRVVYAEDAISEIKSLYKILNEFDLRPMT